MTEDRIYLTVDVLKSRGLLAIITQGQPQYGDQHCTVLALEVVKNMKAAKKWYRRMMAERPWEPRN